MHILRCLETHSSISPAVVRCEHHTGLTGACHHKTQLMQRFEHEAITNRTEIGGHQAPQTQHPKSRGIKHITRRIHVFNPPVFIRQPWHRRAIG